MVDEVLLPVAIGTCKNISPVLLSEETWEYAVSDGAVDQIDARLDGTALSATTILEQGRFRLASKPEGTLTADVYHSANTVPLAVEWLANRLGISPPEFRHFGEFQNTAEVGLWLSGEDTYAAALEKICSSVGAYSRFNQFGKLEIVHIDRTREAEHRITFDDIASINMSGELRELSELTLKYSYLYSTQDSDDEYKNEWKTVTAENENNNYAEQWREAKSIETQLINKSDAKTELSRRAAWRFNRRGIYNIIALLKGVDIKPADRLHVFHPEWDLDATGTVRDVERLPGSNRIELEWVV